MDSLILTIAILLSLMILTFATLPFWMPKVLDWLEKREKHS